MGAIPTLPTKQKQRGMFMNGLYKGKYLIAIYDDDDNIIDVASSLRELYSYNHIIKKSSLRSAISRVDNGKRNSKHLYLIDCLEKHNDLFAEEDKLFLKFIKSITPPTAKELASKINVTTNAINKWRREGTLKEKCKERGLVL